MATQFDTQLQQLYVAYFNRPADPAGLAFYAGHLSTGATTIAAISASFAQSAEYKVAYNQTTFTGVVTAVYQNLFGHAPDAAGLALYADALANGSMTVDQMVTWISGGALGADKVAYDSKVQVAVAFTNALDTEAEATAYNNAAAQTAAKAMLSNIKTAAQATAAVEPAALDAAVAAVVKAGTPFSLESGLAALGAAQAAKAAFLEDQDMTATEIGNAVIKARGELVEQIDNDSFAGASAGVQAALIADQTDYNADALEAANTALEDAQEDVAAVAGLGDAIAAVTSAQAAADEASDAAIEAAGTYNIAANTFTVRNAGAGVTGSAVAGNLVITNAAGTTIASSNATTGVVTVATGVTAANYVGLSALVSAANASVAAQQDAQAAADVALIAKFQVAVLENADVKLVDEFTFGITKPGTEVTVDEVADELAAVAASGNVTNANAFRKQITDFLADADHGTPLADAVLAAEQGGLARAQAAVAEVTGLTQAAALIDAQATLADTDLADGLEYDATANEIVLPGVDGAEDTVVATEVEGKLVIGSTVDLEEYPSLKAYVDAFNAVTAAEAAFASSGVAEGTEAADVVTPTTQALLDAVEAQQAIVDAPVANTTANADAYAAYIAAIGVEGAQTRVEDLAEAIAALEEAQAVATELKSYDDAIAAATADFGTHNFNAPVDLGTAAFGRTGTDIFVVDTDSDTVLNSTISNFGRSGDDVLFVGSGYTFNSGDVTKAGNAGVLEVFFTQSGNNTIVTIEKESYGSNTNSELIKVTLTGVDAADLSFENGIISM